MFGSNPGVYKKYKAAELAAKAYQTEENEEWCVVFKRIKTLKSVITWYKPCRKIDIEEAKKEKFYIAHSLV